MENNGNVEKKSNVWLVVVLSVLAFVIFWFLGTKVYDKLNPEENTLSGSLKEINSKLSDYKDDLKPLFASDNYEVYELSCKNNGSNALYDNCWDETTEKVYYVFDSRIGKIYYTYNVYNGGDDDRLETNYYIFSEMLILNSSNKLETIEEPSDEVAGLVNLNNKTILTGYEDYSCSFHSDVSAITCPNVKNTLVNKDGKFGIYSLVDDKLLLPCEYDTIKYIDDGKYLVEKKGKYGLIDSSMKSLLNIEYDYLGFNDTIGYILIKGSEIKLYDKELNSLELSKLESLYTSALSKEEDSSSVGIANSNSYYWTGGSELIKTDISKKINLDSEGETYFKYTGSTLSGEKFIIFDTYTACQEKPRLYVIDNNKAVLVNSNEVTAEAFCF